MIRRVLFHIAGVDRDLLSTCPETDKVWAAHLGLALLVSFTLILGITFHATGYVIADPWVRFLAAGVIALTVFMFDRALYQSDWFYQGVFRLPDGAGQKRAGAWLTLRRLARITIRLSMSIGLAWVIALFLELTIFSDTITDRIKREHVVANQPVYAKIEEYESQLANEIERRRKNVVTLEALYREQLAALPMPVVAPPVPDEASRKQSVELDAQEKQVRDELQEISEKIRQYAQEMNAEEYGQTLGSRSSGRPGTGPRYRFAKQQRELYELQRTEREEQLERLRTRRDNLRRAEEDAQAAVVAQHERERALEQRNRDALRAQVDRARSELQTVEAARLADISAFRNKTLTDSEFQKQKDDPLSRMRAYQELKSDPQDGATIVLFSWMTKFFVIFLEIAPVVAKMFFSPPSVYAARIQAIVARGRAEAETMWQQASAKENASEDNAAHL